MKSTAQWIIAASVLFQSACAWSESAVANQPYDTIVARNMFGLLHILPPIPPVLPADPPPKITLTGLMNIFGRYQVIFNVAENPVPGQPPKGGALVMCEGERQAGIEVVKINFQDSIVTFNNHGTIQELPLVAPANGSGADGGPGPGNHARRPTATAPASQIYHPENEPDQGQLSPGQNEILIEAQRLKYLQDGNTKMANLLPPTPITRPILQQDDTTQ